MAAPCGRGAAPLVLIALSAAFLTYNALLSTRSFFPPLPIASFPGATTTSPSRRLGTGSRRAFHTAVTASGSVYNTWQCRVMYYWFKEARRERGGAAEMGGFTRILHSGRPDEFVDEIPTFVADPLPDGDQVLRLVALLCRNGNFTNLLHVFFVVLWLVKLSMFSSEFWKNVFCVFEIMQNREMSVLQACHHHVSCTCQTSVYYFRLYASNGLFRLTVQFELHISGKLQVYIPRV
jgi:hypothetical protein